MDAWTLPRPRVWPICFPAETEVQRKLAMRATEGELGRKSDEMRAKLVRAGALIEASIDFADEEVPEDVPAEVFD